MTKTVKNMSDKTINTDICIIGGGLVGKTAALKLAISGYKVVLCAPKVASKDQRTTAFLMQTVTFFEELGIWNKMKEMAFPLKTMRIVDGTNRLIRSPQTEFKSNEIDLEAFGYNLRNADCLELLEAKLNDHPDITILDATVSEIMSVEDHEHVHATAGKNNLRIIAGFVVGADGRNSIVRQCKFVEAREWEYPQTAIVVDFEHERSTNFVSTEFHTESGPFTIVPHSDHKAGLVWMETPEKVAELKDLSNEEFAKVMEEKMQSFLGKITLLTAPKTFPIKGLVAKQFGDKNWALIGESAHVFPPIGAQGFNLGIRDIEALQECLSRYTNQENRGEKYNNARKNDINTRTYGVDLLNKSLLSDFIPVQIMRGLGLHILGSVAPLRKQVMKLGISPKL
jgi:2-octaprenyl-6-methoxyphenol hydroxylase